MFKMKFALLLVALSIGYLACGVPQKGGAEAAAPPLAKPDSLATPGVIEFLGAYGPYTVGEYVFHLRWSDHPREDLYIQDYLPLIYDHKWYTQLVRIELLLDNTKPKEVMNARIRELEALKPVDPQLKYNVSTDPVTGVDILESLTTRDETGDESTAEWNVVRYAPYKSDTGKKGVEIFTYSRRGYGMKVYPFLGEIERDAQKFKGFFMAVPVPVVSVP